MKKLISTLMIFGLMVGNVAYAKNVKLFDLSKHELKSKEEGKIETYQVGDVTLKTDLIYNKKRLNHSNGSIIDLSRQDGFNGMYIIYKRYESQDYGTGNTNLKITFSDEFGENLRITNDDRGTWYLGDKTVKFSKGEEIIKFVLKNKQLKIYRNNKILQTLQTDHMDKVSNVRFNTSEWETVYDLKVIAEN